MSIALWRFGGRKWLGAFKQRDRATKESWHKRASVLPFARVQGREARKNGRYIDDASVRVRLRRLSIDSAPIIIIERKMKSESSNSCCYCGRAWAFARLIISGDVRVIIAEEDVFDCVHWSSWSRVKEVSLSHPPHFLSLSPLRPLSIYLSIYLSLSLSLSLSFSRTLFLGCTFHRTHWSIWIDRWWSETAWYLYENDEIVFFNF